MDLVVSCAVRISHSFQFTLYYPVLRLDHPLIKLVVLMFAGYYVWERQARLSNNHAHSLPHGQLNEENTSGMTRHAALSRAEDESIVAGEKRGSVPVESISLHAQIEKESLLSLGRLIDAEHPQHDTAKRHRDQTLGKFPYRRSHYARWVIPFAF